MRSTLLNICRGRIFCSSASPVRLLSAQATCCGCFNPRMSSVIPSDVISRSTWFGSCSTIRPSSTRCSLLNINLLSRRNFAQTPGGSQPKEPKWKKFQDKFYRDPELKRGGRNAMYFFVGVVVFFTGTSYLAVPLYRAFCQATGFGGTVGTGRHNEESLEKMQKVDSRSIRVYFTCDVNPSLPWQFKPQQTEIVVHPGEAALAFYTAKNLTDRPIIGISTYNIVPYQMGYYFNKVQCFCFEEQLLQPNEEVDMPVFFYIDPDVVDDPLLIDCNDIALSYTFYESKQGLALPQPLTPQDRDSAK